MPLAPLPRMRLKLTIEYAGTRYSGWQIQKNARTVQGEIDRAIREVTGASTFELYGSGRTDAGVHALAQVAHLELPGSAGQRWSAETLRRRINDALPFDINILRIDRARPQFHARHDAVARRYLYQIARRRTAFAKPFVWWIKDPLNDGAMRRAAARFVGTHDFRAFSDDEPGSKSTRVHVEAFDMDDHGDILLIHIEGSHFLWKMVRRLVGVLAEVGRGGLTADQAAALLVEPSPLIARVTAPAAGLFLDRVYYPGETRDAPAHPAVILRPVR